MEELIEQKVQRLVNQKVDDRVYDTLTQVAQARKRKRQDQNGEHDWGKLVRDLV